MPQSEHRNNGHDQSSVPTCPNKTANGSTVIHVYFIISTWRRHTICPLSLHLSQPAYYLLVNLVT